MSEFIKEQAKGYSYSVGEEWDEDEEQTKQSRIKQALNKKEGLADTLTKGIQMMYNPEESRAKGVCHLYSVAHLALETVINDLRRDDEHEVAEGLEERQEAVKDKVPVNRVEDAMEEANFRGHTRGDIRDIMREHFDPMRSFSMWVLAGTDVLDRSRGRGGSRMT